MHISVTNHAIQRYRQRLFDYISPEPIIINCLKQMIEKGCPVRTRLDDTGSVIEIKYRGVAIIARIDNHQATILTCLGEDKFRRWLRYQDSNRSIFGRFKHHIRGNNR